MILGASARSAAFSALRLGLQPIAADLFADADLASACPTATRIETADYPRGLATFAETLPPTSWIYTGAIENHPELVDQISRRHRLLGNSGAILRAVRDPFAVAEALRDDGLVAPELQAIPDGLPEDGSWLVKPRASGGGRGISLWSGDRKSLGPSVYFQKKIDGISLAALFVRTPTTCHYLGLSQQFIGQSRNPFAYLGLSPDFNGQPGNSFAYWGSLGPYPVADKVREQIERIGQLVASKFGLIGIFGVDLVLEEGVVWPIEVNPRYTASVEVIEWATGRSLMGEHLQAFGWSIPIPLCQRMPQGFVAKAIIYADRPILWRGDGVDFPSNSHLFPEIADVPYPGTTFQTGEPILTVLVSADSFSDCLVRLVSTVRDWQGVLRTCEIKPAC